MRSTIMEGMKVYNQRHARDPEYIKKHNETSGLLGICMLATFLSNPFDVLVTKLASQRYIKYENPVQAVKMVIKEEGFQKLFFSGSVPRIAIRIVETMVMKYCYQHMAELARDSFWYVYKQNSWFVFTISNHHSLTGVDIFSSSLSFSSYFVPWSFVGSFGLKLSIKVFVPVSLPPLNPWTYFSSSNQLWYSSWIKFVSLINFPIVNHPFLILWFSPNNSILLLPRQNLSIIS